MMTPLHALHLMMLGLWGGVVLVELLWRRLEWSDQLYTKVFFGAGAVCVNLICFVFVEHRASLGMCDADTRRIRATVMVGLPMGIAALVMGGRRMGWW